MSKQEISDDIWDNKIKPAVENGDLGQVTDIYHTEGLSYSAVGGSLKYNLLHRAAWSGKLDIVKYCVESGGVQLDSRTGTRYGLTALMLAAQSGHVEVVSYLRDQGASVEWTDKWGDTALWECATGNHLPVVYYLLDVKEHMFSEGFSKEELRGAARKGETEAVRYLVEEGLKVEHRQTYKDASVVRTAERGYLEAVKFLVSSGAQVNNKDERGLTALGVAVKNNLYTVVSYLCYLPDIELEASTIEEFDALTTALLNRADRSVEDTAVLDGKLNSLLAAIIEKTPDFADDPANISIFYRGNLYKSLVKLYLNVENQKTRLDRIKLLRTIYIALQAKQICKDTKKGIELDRSKQPCEDSEKGKLSELLGDELYPRFRKEIETVRGNIDDSSNHRLIADKIYAEYIKENKGCIENVKSCLGSCWKGTKHRFTTCYKKVKSCLCSSKNENNTESKKSDKGVPCVPSELYHKCKARGPFALVSCTLAMVFYMLDLITDITVGYDDYTGFSVRLGIFEMVLVGFTWVHENIRSSISQYSIEEELLKVNLGKQKIEISDWEDSDLHMSKSRFKQFLFMVFWPFAVRRKSGCTRNLRAVLFNLLTILQLRPVVDRLRVLLHSPTSLRALHRHQTEQNSLKQFYLITEQIPELMIQFYTLQIVFNLGNQQSGEQQIYSDCGSMRNFSYGKFNDELNNTNKTNWFCDKLPITSSSGMMTCDIFFRIFSMMMPFFMIPSGIVSLEDGFRVLDPVTPKMSTTVKYLLQAAYTLMIPARVFMFAALMHSVSTKEIIFGYIVLRAAMELVINLFDIKTLREYFMAPEDIEKAKKKIASKNRADFIEEHGTWKWYTKKIHFYMRHVFLDYGGALWRISMFSVRDLFAVSVRDPKAYMSNSSNVFYDSLRKGKSVTKRALVFLLEGLVGAVVIEQYYPCGKESDIFRYIGWICLAALILSVTLMSLISDLLNPQLLKSAEQYFLTKSLKIAGAGFLLGCFVSLVFSRSQLRTPAELWTVFGMMTIYLVISGVVILVIKLSAVTSGTDTTKSEESETKCAKCCMLSCCQTSEKIERATKLDSGPICCILIVICCPRHQERELESKLNNPPSQERTDQDPNSTCARNDSPSGSDLSENQEKEDHITPCPKVETEGESQVQEKDTVTQSCCLPLCLHHPSEPAYSKVSCEPVKKSGKKKTILQRINLFKSSSPPQIYDTEMGEIGKYETCDPVNSDDIEPDVFNVQDQTASKGPDPETSPSPIDIDMLPDHVSPAENSSSCGDVVSDSQC